MDNIFSSQSYIPQTQVASLPGAILNESQHQTITSLADDCLPPSTATRHHLGTIQVLEQSEFDIAFNVIIGLESEWAIEWFEEQCECLSNNPSLFLDIVNRLNCSTKKATHLKRINGIYRKFSKKLLAQKDFKSALVAVSDAIALPNARITQWVIFCSALRKTAPVEMKDDVDSVLMAGCLQGLEKHDSNEQIKSQLFDMVRTAQKIDQQLIPAFQKAFKSHLKALPPTKRAEEAAWITRIIPLPFYNELTQLKDLINSAANVCDNTALNMLGLLQSYAERSDCSKVKLFEGIESCCHFFKGKLITSETWETLGLIAVTSSITEPKVAFDIAKHILDGYSSEISLQTALLIYRLLALSKNTDKVPDILLDTVLPALCKSSDREHWSLVEQILNTIPKKSKYAIRCSSLLLNLSKPYDAFLILKSALLYKEDLESRRALLLRAAMQSRDQDQIPQALEIFSAIVQTSSSINADEQEFFSMCSQRLYMQDDSTQLLKVLQKNQKLFEQYSTSVSCVPLLDLLLAMNSPDAFTLAYDLAIRLKPTNSKIWNCLWGKLSTKRNTRRVASAWKVFSALTLEGEAISECSKNALDVAANEAVYSDKNTCQVLLGISSQKEIEERLGQILSRAFTTTKSWNQANLKSLTLFFEPFIHHGLVLTPFMSNLARILNLTPDLDKLVLCMLRNCLKNQNKPLTKAECDLATTMIVKIIQIESSDTADLTEIAMYTLLDAISNPKLDFYNWLPTIEFYINCQIAKAHSVNIRPSIAATVFLGVTIRCMRCHQLDLNAIHWISTLEDALIGLSACANSPSIFAQDLFIPFSRCIGLPLQASDPISNDGARFMIPMCFNIADKLKDKLHKGERRFMLGRRYLLTQCVVALNLMLPPDAEERKVLTNLIHHLLPTTLVDAKSHYWANEWLNMPNNGIPSNLYSLIPNKRKILNVNSIDDIIKNNQFGNLENVSHLFNALISTLITEHQYDFISECYQFILEQIDKQPLSIQIQCLHNLHEVTSTLHKRSLKYAFILGTLPDMVSSSVSVIKEALRKTPNNPKLFHLAMLKYHQVSFLIAEGHQLESNDLYLLILESAAHIAEHRSMLDCLKDFANAVSFQGPSKAIVNIAKLINALPGDSIPKKTAICAIYIKTRLNNQPPWSEKYQSILESLWNTLPHEDALKSMRWLSSCFDNKILPKNWETVINWMKNWNHQALLQFKTYTTTNETITGAGNMLLFVNKTTIILKNIIDQLPKKYAETTLSLWQATLNEALQLQNKWGLQSHILRISLDVLTSFKFDLKGMHALNVKSTKKGSM